MKKYLNILSVSFAILIGIGMVSCEDETINVGNSVVGDDAEGNVKSFDVVAYNAEYDTLRTDKFVLQNGALGIYKDAIFGTTSSKFYTQVRPSFSSIGVTDFGTDTSIDSVNLYIPVYHKSTVKPISKDTLVLSKPNLTTKENDTILITTKYAVDSIYGNKDANMTLNIRDINTVMFNNSKYFSILNGKEALFSTNPRVIGTAKIGNTVVNKVLKVRSATTNIYESPVAYKVTLDKAYFNEKIIQNSKKGLTSDYATFIRENIKGFEFSVEDNDGFILNFNPNNIDLKMHYSFKNPKEKTATDTAYKERINAIYSFDLSNIWSSSPSVDQSKSNVLASQVVNSYSGTTYESILKKVDKTNGDPRLFLNGMSGSYLNLKINHDQFDHFKTEMQSKGLAILGAKLKFYIDDTYNLVKPPYIVAWNEYKKDNTVTSSLYSDLLGFLNSYPNSVHFNPMVTGKTDYYTIDITKHLKSMIEKGDKYEDQSMIITMGNFITSVTDPRTINSTNPYQNNRAYNPYRIVLHGNNSELDAKKLKLLVYYSIR